MNIKSQDSTFIYIALFCCVGFIILWAIYFAICRNIRNESEWLPNPTVSNYVSSNIDFKSDIQYNLEIWINDSGKPLDIDDCKYQLIVDRNNIIDATNIISGLKISGKIEYGNILVMKSSSFSVPFNGSSNIRIKNISCRRNMESIGGMIRISPSKVRGSLFSIF